MTTVPRRIRSLLRQLHQNRTLIVFHLSFLLLMCILLCISALMVLIMLDYTVVDELIDVEPAPEEAEDDSHLVRSQIGDVCAFRASLQAHIPITAELGVGDSQSIRLLIAANIRTMQQFASVMQQCHIIQKQLPPQSRSHTHRRHHCRHRHHRFCVFYRYIIALFGCEF